MKKENISFERRSFSKKKIPENPHFVRIEKNLRNLKRLKYKVIKFSKTGIETGPRTICSRTGGRLGEFSRAGMDHVADFRRFFRGSTEERSLHGVTSRLDRWNECRTMTHLPISRRLKRLRGYPVHGIRLLQILFSALVSLKVRKKKKRKSSGDILPYFSIFC